MPEKVPHDSTLAILAAVPRSPHPCRARSSDFDRDAGRRRPRRPACSAARSRPAADFSARQLVEHRHFARPSIRRRPLHRLHRTNDAAPGLRRRRRAGQRAGIRLPVRRRGRHGAPRPCSFSMPTRATASTTRPVGASPSTRFRTRRSRRRTGSRAASRATSTCAAQADRHLLIVDRDQQHLYELYNVFYDGSDSGTRARARSST